MRLEQPLVPVEGVDPDLNDLTPLRFWLEARRGRGRRGPGGGGGGGGENILVFKHCDLLRKTVGKVKTVSWLNHLGRPELLAGLEFQTRMSTKFWRSCYCWWSFG